MIGRASKTQTSETGGDMDLTLQRIAYSEDGVFSLCTRDDTKAQVMVTLEHAYEQKTKDFRPIIKPGVYNCVRGIHTHENGTKYETFEVIGVEGHWGILFHSGNWNHDSKGCILCGDDFAVGGDVDGDGEKDKMIINSRKAFKRFMKLQEGLKNFQLTVIAENLVHV